MKNIETEDIVFAAYLKVSGYSLDRIEKHGNKGTFAFSNVEDQDIKNFDLGTAKVEPVTFNTCVKALVTAVRRAM